MKNISEATNKLLKNSFIYKNNFNLDGMDSIHSYWNSCRKENDIYRRYEKSRALYLCALLFLKSISFQTDDNIDIRYHLHIIASQ